MAATHHKGGRARAKPLRAQTAAAELMATFTKVTSEQVLVFIVPATRDTGYNTMQQVPPAMRHLKQYRHIIGEQRSRKQQPTLPFQPSAAATSAQQPPPQAVARAKRKADKRKADKMAGDAAPSKRAKQRRRNRRRNRRRKRISKS